MTKAIRLPLRRDRVVLFTLGMSELIYGAALVTSTHSAIWWPASLTNLLGVSIHLWGWLWVLVGCYILFGLAVFYPLWRKRIYAPAAILNVTWAMVAVIHFWGSTPHQAVWGPAAIYLAFAVLVLALGWPDQWEVKSENHSI